MSARYLELDSTYRNRNQYPKPSEFVVEVSQSGQGSRITAKDPVSQASPILVWENSFQEQLARNDTNTSVPATQITVDSTIDTSTARTLLNITAPVGVLRDINDFYNGAVFDVTVGGTANIRRRIVDYQYINSTTAIIEVDSAFPDGAFGAASGVIANPSGNVPTNTASSVVKFFIPAGSNYDNFYVDCYVQSMGVVITEESRQITAYDGTTHLATLASSTTDDWNNNAAAAENFVIRCNLPQVEDNLLGVSANGHVIQLSSASSPQSDIYVGSFVRMTDPAPGETGVFAAHGGVGTATFQLAAAASAIDSFYVGMTLVDTTTGEARVVATYNGGAQTGTVTANWGAGAGTDSYYIINPVAPYAEERRIVSYYAENGTFTAHGGAATNTFTLDNQASNTDNFYVGLIITDTTTGETREVATYNGTTRSGTVTTNWGAGAANDLFVFRSATLSAPFSGTVQGVYAYEIEQFTRDNSVPFTYTGSLVSQQQSVCYEIELLNLVIPNTLLQSGSRAVFYPYLYVELQSVSSSSSGSNGLIYSNNPNANKMLFRAVVDDNAGALISPFIKIDGDGMVQTIKFKPNDALRFAVYIPNGSLFETSITDTTSPTRPDPLVQISALFSLKRL